MAVGEAATFTRRRIGYFDVAKLIAMASVITMHTAIRFGSVKVTALVTTFQMPLFFILNGYFMHPDGAFRLKKECRALLLPYVVTAFAVVVALCATNQDCGRFLVHPTPRSPAASGSRPGCATRATPRCAPSGTSGATG